LDEAEQGGAWIEPANKYSIDNSQRKMVTQLVMDAPEDSQLMQNEIFGPVLPIVAYKNLDEAITKPSTSARNHWRCMCSLMKS
jgi:acyl-CoA reductase-like NAD-dependent aldehyde dehydrogenase